MAELVGEQPSTITYDRRAGQFRGADGRFVPAAVIERLVNQEVQRSQVRLKAHTRLMAEGQISLAEWQTRMAESLRDSHLRLMAFGSGGKEQLTQRHYGAAGYQLRRQYEFLDNFAHQLFEGKLTAKQAINRAARYAASAQITFHRAVQISREQEGFNVAKRLLDAQAQHCPDCIGHERTEWTPIAEIVAPGTNCQCQNNCRCRIVYGRRDLSNRGILAG